MPKIIIIGMLSTVCIIERVMIWRSVLLARALLPIMMIVGEMN